MSREAGRRRDASRLLPLRGPCGPGWSRWGVEDPVAGVGDLGPVVAAFVGEGAAVVGLVEAEAVEEGLAVDECVAEGLAGGMIEGRVGEVGRDELGERVGVVALRSSVGLEGECNGEAFEIGDGLSGGPSMRGEGGEPKHAVVSVAGGVPCVEGIDALFGLGRLMEQFPQRAFGVGQARLKDVVELAFDLRPAGHPHCRDRHHSEAVRAFGERGGW